MMRSRPLSFTSLLASFALVGVLGAIVEGYTPRPSSSAVANPRVGAYRGYISRSGKPRGKYKKHGLSSAARRRSIAGHSSAVAGVKKRRRGNR